MKIAVNFNDSKDRGGFQVIYCDETGDIIEPYDLVGRIVVGCKYNDYEELVIILSDYTFSNVIDGDLDG